MFAACILFALPTIKEELVKSDRHPVYNSRVHGIGEPRDIFKELDSRNEGMKLLQKQAENQQELPVQGRTLSVEIRRLQLRNQKHLLNDKLKSERDDLEETVTKHRAENAKPMPDAALTTKLQKQINNLRDAIAVTQKELSEVEKQIETNK